MKSDDTDRQTDHQDALRDLQRLRHEGDALGGIFTRWLSVPAADSTDPIEIRGTRIGRTLSVVALVALCVYMAWTHLR